MSTPVRTAHPVARALTALFAAVGLIAGAGALPASAAPAPPINYVNLGDSYSAGWGAGAPAINLEYGQEAGTCYVSGPDHVTRLSALKSVDLAGDFACAGSTLGPSEHSEPDLTKQIQTAVLAGDLNGSTDLVTLTGGGNDLGFEGMLQACAAQKAQGQSCTPIFEAGITNAALITPLTAAVAGQIRAAAPNARIAWAGYPHLFVLDANGKLLHSQNTGELEAGKSYDKGRFLAFVKRFAPASATAARA